MRTILVVDDELNIREITKAYLNKEGFEVLDAPNGQEAMAIFKENKIDLVILDLMMPIMNGEQVCEEIRKVSTVPIIMLTAKVEEADVIKGIKGGADDYMKKPFSVRELITRVHSIFRRMDYAETSENGSDINIGDLAINFDKFVVTKSDEPVSLTPNEFKILKTMVDNAEIVLSREVIIEKTFGIDFDGFDRTIDTHIKNLRQKLENDPKKPKHIKTVYSMGYKFSK